MSQRKILHSIPELCSGCHMCELMCSLIKTGTINRYLARLRIDPSNNGFSWTPVLCRHCDPAPCQQACPVLGAMSMDDTLRVVSINDAECIRCMACVQACPFGAIQVSQSGEILKCDLCGGDPICVKYCPPRPENSVPNLPVPRQSCLQYSESYRITDAKRITVQVKDKAVQLPKVDWRKRHQIAPWFDNQHGKEGKHRE